MGGFLGWSRVGGGDISRGKGLPMAAVSEPAEVRRAHRSELTPLAFLERSVLVYPDKVAVVHEDRRYTYREFGERVNRLASALRAAGLRKGDRVAFLAPNIPALLEAHYGVPAAGGVLVALNYRLNAEDIGYILKHSGARFLGGFNRSSRHLDHGGVRWDAVGS